MTETTPAYARQAGRLRDIRPSPIRAVFDRAHELEAAGTPIVHLEIGRPDFDTPAGIKRAATAALDAGAVHYGPNAGVPELRAAISDHLHGRDGVRYAAAGGVLVTIGANEAVFLAVMAYCGPGDEVIVPVPAWAHYAECVRLAGATPVPLPLDPASGYRLDPDALAAACTPRTRMIVVCTPNNPTGTVADRATLERVAEVVAGTDALVLSDEIYAELVYDGAEHVSPASVGALGERTLTVGGLAKSHAMDGWRIGWLAGPPDLVRPALRVRQFTTVCPTTFTQAGAVHALRESAAESAAMRAAFAERRRAGLDLLAGQDVLSVSPSDGAFYFYLRYPDTFEPAEQLVWRLLEERHVAVVPGTAFAPADRHAFRVSYACDIDDLRTGLTRVIAAFA
ncbi:MAG TPA: aminotransferase class I/II-fold pyridoxal phosphate-dependent enzyme [Streptosporangiaceae bacterium]|jgi:aspartate/methionine/tyrosine aminotransferase